MSTPENEPCPECGSKKTRPIVYGYPLESTMKAAQEGLVELGGCLVWGDDPDMHCPDCRHRWIKNPDSGEK